MKVITIKQPFASLIAEGLKEYEFRTWKTKYRGEVLIHAGKSVDKEAMKRFESLELNYPLGCIIAKATLSECVEVNDELKGKLRSKENSFVYLGTTENSEWMGYGFKLENIQKIDPIKINGQLGLWEYNDVI
ncbi:MAG: ASCH domain-containing protein [Erysipelotrichales bacterium]|nr:ASCH domain-containing protein [Erysipelotrichales bacterium]